MAQLRDKTTSSLVYEGTLAQVLLLSRELGDEVVIDDTPVGVDLENAWDAYKGRAEAYDEGASPEVQAATTAALDEAKQYEADAIDKVDTVRERIEQARERSRVAAEKVE